MNAIPGATPISLEDAAALIPGIVTQQELNEWEAVNILRARKWALAPRVLARVDPTNEIFLRKLHEKMFDQTWKWAGKYRRKDGYNIGCSFVQIVQLVPQLLGNVRFWIEHKT